MWGEVVSVVAVVGWGDGERGLVLYVRVQTAPPESKTNPRWLSDSLGLSALSARGLTLMSSRALKRG